MTLTACVLFATAAVAPAPHAVRHYEKLTKAYFRAWNVHDANALSELFHETVTLRDWNVSKAGKKAVVDANAAIWATVPNISIEVLTTHVSESTRTVASEILVDLKNGKDSPLKVVDIISFNEEDKISSVRAYKG